MIHLFLFAWLAGQAGTSDAQQHLQAGLEARKQHQIEVEITEFRKAAESDPNLADAFVNLGAAYMEKRDYGAAIIPLKRALELSPDLAIAHQLVGYALLAQGYSAEAIPQDLLYYLGHASGLLSKDAIDNLLATHPDSARAHQALAENYFVLRQMPQAEKEYLEALRVRPELPGLHLELGQVYANSAQWPKAEAEFRAECKLRPGNAEAAYRLGAALLQQGRARDALPELKRSNELKPDMPETLYSLGKAASLVGDSAIAEGAWLKVIELEKSTSLAAQAHFGLAGLYRKQGKSALAQREMQEFQKLQSTIGPPRSE